MARHNRNFQGIRHQSLREKVDPILSDLVDELEDCYYGDYTSETTPRLTNGWKHGVPRQWLGISEFDVQTTPELSKQLFDLLHGLLHHVYVILFDKVNQAEPSSIPRSEYDEDTDADQVVHSRLADTRTWIITTLNDAGNELDLPKLNVIRNMLIQRVKSDLKHTIDLN